MTGRLLRQARTQSDFPECKCGHAVEQHHERGEVAVFPCDSCKCINYTRSR